MRCRDAERALLERELDRLSPEGVEALDRHLERCERCAAAAEIEARIASDLATLQVDVPFEIDVTARVMEAITSRTPRRREVNDRQLGWAAAVAMLGVALLAAGLRDAWPDLLLAVRQAGAVAAGLWQAMTPLTTLAAGLLGVLARLLGSVIEMIESLSPLWRRLEPLAVAGITVAALTMVTTIAWVVGRDLLHAAPARSRGGWPGTSG